MINIFTLSSLAFTMLHMAMVPASTNGYVSHLPSHQAFCKDLLIPGCGAVKYEPQSVEGLKGSFACNGDRGQFPELNDDNVWENYFISVPSDSPLSFTWMIIAPHRTYSWEYFILTEDIPLLASFKVYGAMPPNKVVHEVPLSSYTGKQTILACWNRDDTPTTFYACVDLNINPSNAATAVTAAAAMQLPISMPLAGPGSG